MRTDITKFVDLPEGYNVEIKDNTITLSANGKTLSKTLDLGRVKISNEDKKIKVFAKTATRRELKMIGTTVAHIKNMIKGLEEDFVYELEICNVHFPMNVKLEGDKVIIKSFLGEKTQRTSKVLPNVKVDIKASNITVSSYDLEAAGQTAANLEKATKPKGRDRRIFQDGIFIVNKPGRKI